MISAEFQSSEQIEATLFCFPYGGAGASIYAPWIKQFICSNVAIVPIQLPGREEKILESGYSDIDSLVNDLALQMRPWMRRPFAFFGHCMGALIAYDLSHQLSNLYNCLPTHLFISACPAPHVHHVPFPMHQLPPEDFLKALEKISTVKSVTDQKVANILFPSLKADFRLYENYSYKGQGALPVDVTTFRGKTDDYVSQEKLTAWQELCNGDFSEKEFSGDHLYLHAESTQLIYFMIKVLTQD